MAQNVLGSGVIGTVKHISFHGIVISFIVVLGSVIVVIVLGVALGGFADHEIADILLLFSHAVPDFLDGLAALILVSMLQLVLVHVFVLLIIRVIFVIGFVVFIGLFGFFFLFFGLVLILVVIRLLLLLAAGFLGMADGHVIPVDDGFVFQLVIQVAVGQHNVLDGGAHIGAGQDDAQFLDVAVGNLPAIDMFQAVGINAQTLDVLVPKRFLHALGFRVVVEVAFRPYALRLVEQECVPQHHVRIIMNMLPDNRHLSPFVSGKRSLQDRAAVCAFNAELGRPSAEIGFSLITHWALLCSHKKIRQPDQIWLPVR